MGAGVGRGRGAAGGANVAVGKGRGVGGGTVVAVGCGVTVAWGRDAVVGLICAGGIDWDVSVDAGAGTAVVAAAVGTACWVVDSGVGLGWEHPVAAKSATAVRAAVRPNLKAYS
jgi:hypothetical protein